ncbi:hypothetical protein NEHOM01_2323 [Nematocida homosporus]|uniref:uncharacterized protein n=1 Tax=Nematocida homosporus TaxID=1912981 RepID=UPI00221F3CB9|nr:uncharacterized protein NEHOM01_2323 [Nematocida homosporus]KAI5187726.1 hypothetical protein NEHOM01_2323 [Nematocida homosporus]
MEEYIGANLIIKTPNAIHIGILQRIDSLSQKLHIDVSGALKVIDLREIDEVELLGEEEVQSLQEIDRPISSTTSNSSANSISKTQSKPQSQSKHISNQSNSNPNLVPEERKPSKYQAQLDWVSAEMYQQVLETSASIYGPSRDEVIFSGARGLLHLVTNIFKFSDKHVIMYIGNGIFAEIAISLARLCIPYEVDVSVVLMEEPTARMATHLFYYKHCGGKMAECRTDQSVIILADVIASEAMISRAEKVMFLGEYQNIPGLNQEVVFFGMPINDPAKFSGSAILCDIGLSLEVYRVFGLKKYRPKLLQKLAK